MKKLRWILILTISGMLLGCTSNIRTGVAYLEEKDYKAAVASFTKEIEKEKNLGEAYRGLGIALYELEDYEQAVDAFKKALENKAQETAAIYHLMAVSCLKMEKYQIALEYYSDARKMKDCTEEMEQEILYNEIAIYQKLGDWETLKEKVSAYVETYPEDDRMAKTVEFLKTR